MGYPENFVLYVSLNIVSRDAWSELACDDPSLSLRGDNSPKSPGRSASGPEVQRLYQRLRSLPAPDTDKIPHIFGWEATDPDPRSTSKRA